MFSAVFVNGGISSQSSTFYAAAINHSHVSVLHHDGAAGARDDPDLEGSSVWMRSLKLLRWRMRSSPGDCGDFVGVFFFHRVPVQACMPGLPLVAAFMEELMACKLPLRLQLFLRAAVEDLFSSISPVFTIQISCFGVFH